MKAFFVFALIFAVAFAGEIVCTLCKDTVKLLENLITQDGAEAAKNYITNLCAKASGFLGDICHKVLNFGVDELIKLIENRTDANVICQKIHAC